MDHLINTKLAAKYRHLPKKPAAQAMHLRLAADTGMPVIDHRGL
jgi:hypothetical protein